MRKQENRKKQKRLHRRLNSMVNNKVILIGRMTKDAAVVDAKEG